MLRVGLTGSLGSGKTTAGKLFAARGARVFNADEIGRELMQPGQPVYDKIVTHFGSDIVLSTGYLDRPAIARIVFADPATLADLNAIVHPATLARQAELLSNIHDPHAIAVIESALIFETTHGGDPRSRFDRIVLVTAPEADRIARYIDRTHPSATTAQRTTLEAEARSRLTQQIPDEEKGRRSDFVLTNNGSLAHLEAQVDQLWPQLQRQADQSV